MSSQLFRVISGTPAASALTGLTSKRDERAAATVQTSVSTLNKSVEALGLVLKATTEELGNAKREVRALADAQGEATTTVSVEIKSLVNRAQKTLVEAVGRPAQADKLQELLDAACRQEERQKTIFTDVAALQRGLQEHSVTFHGQISTLALQVQSFETKLTLVAEGFTALASQQNAHISSATCRNSAKQEELIHILASSVSSHSHSHTSHARPRTSRSRSPIRSVSLTKYNTPASSSLPSSTVLVQTAASPSRQQLSSRPLSRQSHAHAEYASSPSPAPAFACPQGPTHQEASHTIPSHNQAPVVVCLATSPQILTTAQLPSHSPTHINATSSADENVITINSMDVDSSALLPAPTPITSSADTATIITLRSPITPPTQLSDIAMQDHPLAATPAKVKDEYDDFGWLDSDPE
ncbi:hypothetical protein BKA62DRAFT_721787 [Auriculariales sp. MPI-PUGE-AT-0066]|nr:hypothetical protein BKA62DRAFT_721787 [Auriculariales sp. MPI-PUGE-AT-0066]